LSIHLNQWSREGWFDPAVVMVHGSAQGSSIGGDLHFSRQAFLATQGWRVIVPDRPGHGRSAVPGRADDADEDGRWVAQLLGESSHLVGHSFGGCVALAAAAQNPHAVLSLTLIEPAMHAVAASDPKVQPILKEMVGIYRDATSTEDLAIRFAQLVNIPPDTRNGSSTDELDQMRKELRQLKLPPPDLLRQQLDVVKAAGIPFLVVTGGWSPAFDATGEAVADLGGGSHELIPSPHHFPQLVSSQFNEALVRLMTDVAQRPAEHARIESRFLTQ
jgi:pimeloyl-ACP methyl ester carboxylesterase